MDEDSFQLGVPPGFRRKGSPYYETAREPKPETPAITGPGWRMRRYCSSCKPEHWAVCDDVDCAFKGPLSKTRFYRL